ncbi:hypothetical protein CC117_28285 [Parafrankia colletiae]|uniref:SnoaL-like domain-containing protein n=1 Tax=Parafrankia colletiae TaxID=573497 RepID=A0A1S1Q8J7_9ACTN|nr:nuclear transport factor 2 family protein [Parafrankia colletiae]MCK9903304.1 nuclear transport factor 2 family protein [Frankia sp. Cpl3]OHV29821.1 hypothetical protein CC117_28285 [Parafrankia colletiae]
MTSASNGTFSDGVSAGHDLASDRRALRRLLDKDAIVDLVHRYSYCVDHRLHDELAALFTEDCTVDYGPGSAPVIHGRSEFRAMFSASTPPNDQPGFVRTSHHNANVLTAFDTDDRATVRTSMYAWHRTTAGTTPQVWGYYHDVVVRTPDGWKFHERKLHLLGTDGWHDGYHRAVHTAPEIAAPATPTAG